MNAYVRLSACAAALAVAFYSLDYFQPGWVMEVGPALGRLSELRSRLQGDADSMSTLDEQTKTVFSRIQAKRQIVQSLAADRMTLLEAAVQFHDLERDLPEENKATLRRHFPSGSDAECYCWQAIAFTEAELSSWPKVATEVGGRLRAELRELLTRGAITLPEK
jgi:hypothetical protein